MSHAINHKHSAKNNSTCGELIFFILPSILIANDMDRFNVLPSSPVEFFKNINLWLEYPRINDGNTHPFSPIVVIIDGLKCMLGKLADDVKDDGEANDSDKFGDELLMLPVCPSDDVPMTSNSPSTSLVCDTADPDELGVDANIVDEEVVPCLEKCQL